MQVIDGGVVVVSDDGSEVARYSPEEWRHKQIMDALKEIKDRLTTLEATASAYGQENAVS